MHRWVQVGMNGYGAGSRAATAGRRRPAACELCAPRRARACLHTSARVWSAVYEPALAAARELDLSSNSVPVGAEALS